MSSLLLFLSAAAAAVVVHVRGKKQSKAHTDDYTSSSRVLEDGSVEVPTSCKGLADGQHILSPMADEAYPLVLAKCSHEYTMIDPSVDASWSAYFSSWEHWHHAIAGPGKNDRVNWNEWLLTTPDDPEPMSWDPLVVPTRQEIAALDKPTRWLMSPQCDACDADEEMVQLFGDKTAYHMSGAAWGMWAGIRRPACDPDWDTYQCHTCKASAEGNIVTTPRPPLNVFEDRRSSDNEGRLGDISYNIAGLGLCLTEARNAYSPVVREWAQFTAYGSFQYKPSIGLDGRFCQCVQNKEEATRYARVSQEAWQGKLASLKEEEEQEQSGKNSKHRKKEEGDEVTYLYASDFAVGTYRITEGGVYVLMEDVWVDFNAPDEEVSAMDSPNAADMDWWRPPSDDPAVLEKYPGSGNKGREAYMMGYFAAITIECSDVVLDLNGHTIGMSLAYFLQQPFFAIVQLMSQSFLPNQGPGFFGANPQFAKNVLIKDGVIGRSSHHGIHGSRNEKVRLENVRVRDFGTHGIQFNGYDGLQLENVEIGPTTSEAYLNHNYGHMRVVLPYLRKMSNFDEQHKTATIRFDASARDDGGKEYTMDDLIAQVVPKMDRVYQYVMSAEFDEEELAQLVETDEDFALFANPVGVPYGSSVYGLWLNFHGSGIHGWAAWDDRSSDVMIKNLKVHDMHHHGRETIGFARDAKRFSLNTVLATVNLVDLFGSLQTVQEWAQSRDDDGVEDTQPHYVGNIVTDIWLAMSHFGSDRLDEWWMGTPYFGEYDQVIRWAMGEVPFIWEESGWEPMCAMDGMGHSGKGMVGVKMTNVDDLRLHGSIEVYNLFDTTPLTAEGVCIRHNERKDGKEYEVVVTAQMPYMSGFSMNQVLAMSAELAEITLLDETHISVHNVRSATGRVFGVASWFSTSFDVAGKASVRVHDISAGQEVPQDMFEYHDTPNHAAEACAWLVYDGKETHVDVEMLLDEESTTVEQFCVKGNAGCHGVEGSWTDLKRVAEDVACADGDDEEGEDEVVDAAAGVALWRVPEARVIALALLSLVALPCIVCDWSRCEYTRIK